MKKIFKQSFSLVLALLMVLSLVPVQPVSAANGYQWSYVSGYDWLTGTFETADTDGVYEAGQAYDWYATLAPTKGAYTISVSGNIVDDATGATISSVSKSVDVAKGPAKTPIISYQDFPELTEDLAGTFTLTCVVSLGGKNYAQLQARFTRNAPAPSVAYGAEWQYLTGYEWVSGNVATADADHIFEEGQAYDWAVTVSPTSTAASVIVNATITNKAGEVISTVTDKAVDCGKAPAVTTLLTAADFPELTGELLGDYKLEASVSIGTKSYAGVNYIFGRTGAYTEPEEPETPAPVEYKAEWTYKTGYEFINGAFNTAEEDFIFDGTPYDWTVTINSDKSTGARLDATLETQDGQILTASKEFTIPVGEFQLFDYTAFPQLTNDLIGNFKLTATITVKLNGVETPVAQLEAVFGRSAAYVEPAPEEPEVPATPTKPGEILWQYASSAEGVGYDWLTGAIATETAGGIYKGWDAYDWRVTLSPTKVAAEVTVEATLEDHTGAVISTYTSEPIAVSKAPSVTTILTAGNFKELSNKMLGDFRVTAVIKYTNPETQETSGIAQVQFVFGRRIGDAGYTAVEHLPTYDWINGSFSAVDADMTYVGIQHYDWRATIAPSKSAATVDVAVTVVNAQGETVATLNKTGVECAKGGATALVTAGEIAELTADLYGKFAITTVASMGGKAYAGIYGVIEHVEGEFVADTVAPEFGPANWENCGLPTAVTVANNGEMNKQIQVKISITDAERNVLASMDKTATVGAGASGELVTTNQLRGFIKERGATYYVVIEGRWSNGYDEYTINETLTYTWTDHSDIEVVPGYPATCTETGLTDGEYCHGCEGTITEQVEIPVDSEAHNFVDGTCACGATEVPTDPNLKFTKTNSSGGDLMLGDDIRATFRAKKPSGYTDMYLEIVMNDNLSIVKKLDAISTSSNFGFVYVVPAPLMTTDIQVTLVGVKNGVTYRGEVINFSIRKCAEAKLESWITDSTKELDCKLLMNMLYYGERAQIQFTINTDNLATTGLDEYAYLINRNVPSMGTYPAVDTTGMKATISSMGFMLQEKVKLTVNFKLTSNITNEAGLYEVVIKHHRSKDGQIIEYKFGPGEFEIYNSGKGLRVFFDKLAPSQLRDDVEFTLYRDGVAVSATYIRSMDMVASTYEDKIPEMIYAVMNYADAAKAKFG